MQRPVELELVQPRERTGSVGVVQDRVQLVAQPRAGHLAHQPHGDRAAGQLDRVGSIRKPNRVS